MESFMSHDEYNPASPYHALDADMDGDASSKNMNFSSSMQTQFSPSPSKPQNPLSKRNLFRAIPEGPISKEMIRNEWVDAIYGPDFFPREEDPCPIDYVPTLKGVGNANIPSYVAYSACIESRSTSDKQKIGVTISRLPLGVYAHAVDDGSEAYAAGVIPGSVLVDINGMGVLGEPSHKLIERLWQYEGFGTMEGGKGAVDGMVALRFIRCGKVYDTIFLNKPPFGISWAPCGNFALVQRSYSYAQKAGIKRGCIIASVNGKSFRNLDHVSAAETLRELFVKKGKITMTLAYTPAASRSSFFATLNQSSSPSASKTHQNQTSSTLSFLQNTISCGSSVQQSNRSIAIPPTDEITKLAERVAAGEIQPAASETWKRQSKRCENVNGTGEAKYLPCPQLDRTDLFGKWDIFNALFYCLKVGMADFSEENFKLIPQFEDLGDEIELCVENLDAFGLNEISIFLLQIVGIIGHNELNEEMGERFGCAVIDLIKESDDLCFRLHFLFLAFLGVFTSEATTSYSTLAYLKDKLNVRLAELESTRSVLQLQSQSQSMQENVSLDQNTYVPDSKSFDRMQDIVEGLFDEISMEKNNAKTELHAFDAEEINGNEKKNEKKKKKGFIKRFFRKKSKGVKNGQTSSPYPTSQFVQDNPSEKLSYSEDEIVHNSSTSPVESPKSQTSYLPILSKSMSSKSQNENTPAPILRNKRDKLISPFQIRNTISAHTQESSHLAYMSTYIKEMDNFLTQLDEICFNLQNQLIKTNSQKVVEWAMQPWNATKEKKLLEATEQLRTGLREINSHPNVPLINPVNATEILSEVDPDESFILPSAHFPLLLTFNKKNHQIERSEDDVLYRTKVEVVALRGGEVEGESSENLVYFVQGSVAGQVQETGKSSLGPYFESTLHRWYDGNSMTFDTRSSWGYPNTLSIKMKAVDPSKSGSDIVVQGEDDGNSPFIEVGYCWVDLSDLWMNSSDKIVCYAPLYSSNQIEVEFDMQGDLIESLEQSSQRLELELRISTDAVSISPDLTNQHPKLCSKTLLLYKHTEDIRQEMLALQFIEVCNKLLISSGLDLKIRSFDCCPVGAKCGFVEWVQGSVPLSEICERGGTASLNRKKESKNNSSVFFDGMEMEDKSGRVPPESSPPASPPVSPSQTLSMASLERSRFSVLKRLSNYTFGFGVGLGRQVHATIRNPIQDFLRSAAYDPKAPYFISKAVMDTYIKSCAGYCILTYLLGVGDRHLDNLLLHPRGHFLHCDFSYILGQDPKTYIPMRITEEMVIGMGGRESDNYAKFLSLAGAAFVALRRPSNLRVLMSMIRIMVGAKIPDVSLNQSAEDALYAMRYRFRLDLSENDALSFIEKLIETSITSKIWVAVDAIHSFGKKF